MRTASSCVDRLAHGDAVAVGHLVGSDDERVRVRAADGTRLGLGEAKRRIRGALARPRRLVDRRRDDLERPAEARQQLAPVRDVEARTSVRLSIDLLGILTALRKAAIMLGLRF